MKTSIRRVFLYGVMITLASTLLWSCASSNKPAEVKCAGAVEWQICDDAEITSFACELGSFKKKPALVYTVAVKNTSAKAHRYRLNIFLLDQDKAAGHLVPRKGKPPVVKPGETVTVKVPFFKAEKTSEKMLVILKTLGE
ncbi:MAG: hypothetical protein J7L25_10055 [Deltaproteobacteria bacterium]|nr:hypothetical protein [Candidatus Tharpella aukensis]